MLLEINPINPPQRKIDQVVDLLRRGGVIAYPTDTIYGIGCDIMNKKAIERIYQIKQIPRSSPFSFICSDLKNISQYAKVSNYAYKTMRRLLPGPYTFVLEGSREVPKMMLTPRKTAGIRVGSNCIEYGLDNLVCVTLDTEVGSFLHLTCVYLVDWHSCSPFVVWFD